VDEALREIPARQEFLKLVHDVLRQRRLVRFACMLHEVSPVLLQLAWTDAIHLNNQGHQIMGDRLMRALLEDNARYRALHPDAGCGAPKPEK
jgi:lysophospholipase L1-like esterase